MAPAPTAPVTAKGIRDGDRAALGALVARRGAAVLAYCDRVAAPGRALEAAGEAFARFRREVVAAVEPRALDPEALLLGATRRAAAACGSRPAAPRGTLARRRGATCALVPELLAARAEGDLTAADRMRLARHLERCEDCLAAAARFAEGERAYHDAPDVPPPDPAAGGLLAALRAAAPNADERRAPPRPQPAGAVINGNGRALTGPAAGSWAGEAQAASAAAPEREPAAGATAAGPAAPDRAGASPTAAAPPPVAEPGAAGRSGASPGADRAGAPPVAAPDDEGLDEPYAAPTLSWDPADLAAATGRDRPWPVVATRILVPALVLVAAVVVALAVAGVFAGGDGKGPGGSIETEAVLPASTVHVPRRALTTPLPDRKGTSPSGAHRRSAASSSPPPSAPTPAPPTSSPSATPTPTPPAAPPPQTGAARRQTRLDARTRKHSDSAAPAFDGGAPAADEPGFQPSPPPSQ